MSDPALSQRERARTHWHPIAQACRSAVAELAVAPGSADAPPLRIFDVSREPDQAGLTGVAGLTSAGISTRAVVALSREEPATQAYARAEALGLTSVTFADLDLDDVERVEAQLLGGPVQLLLALHACDTASDDALATAITRGVPAIVCAPCCHEELAEQLEHATRPPNASLVRCGVLRRRYASALTDALRLDLLEACGYEVGTISWPTQPHMPAQLIVHARRRDTGPVNTDAWALDKVGVTCDRLGVRPGLLAALVGFSAGAGTR
ncbi:MAG: methyltransferase [Myxococcales bacterium FL481]|nr:MAG: methyltransferase [Myxococcales bacterium FL481]